MTDTSGFGGFSMLELFKLEAESHCAALSDGLLALERSPNDRAVVEPLMRAAHSIKGAARIVGLDVIVSLAHVMEECFLAAKDGREPLTSARVDQLLKGVDVLGEVRTLAEADLPAWTAGQAERIAGLVAQLKAPPPAAAPAPAQAPPPPTVAAPAAIPAPVLAPPAASPAGPFPAPPPVPTPAAVAPAPPGSTLPMSRSRGRFPPPPAQKPVRLARARRSIALHAVDVRPCRAAYPARIVPGPTPPRWAESPRRRCSGRSCARARESRARAIR